MNTNPFILAIFFVLWCVVTSEATTLFPNSKTATNDIELGVEGISRLCPTGMWDHWTFRDIAYDKGSNTVVFVIQLNSLDDDYNGKRMTTEDVKKQTEWIVKNIMEGYNELIKSPRIMCEGDFMLYLSLGTLLKQMEKDGATLRIALLKPDYENLAIKDIPLSLTSAELNFLLNKNESH